MKQIIIGIDPDVEMSGVARLDKEQRKVWADHLPFALLIEYLLTMREVAKIQGARLSVYVEASWLISHNWLVCLQDTKAVVAKKGRNVGAMQQVGKLIIELCQHYGIDAVEQIPLKKVWKGKGGKITHEEMTQVCGWDKKRSNQEERDAMLIAWYASGLPISIKVSKR